MERFNSIIDGKESAASERTIPKFNPHNGELLGNIGCATQDEVVSAFNSARRAFESWKRQSAIQRGQILFNFCDLIEKNRQSLSRCIQDETGKSHSDSLGEITGSIQLGKFFASEGQRLYGKTTTSNNPLKRNLIFREPVGVALLIVSANTPIANIAWKVFPALVCGNACVLKASENAPLLAILLAKISREAGLPDGVLNVIQGDRETGSDLVNHKSYDLLSFTGSSRAGKLIEEATAGSFKKVSLEMGGKNAFIVCRDADIENAVNWAVLSAFSNAGQRCASASRFIIEKEIYEVFRNKFVQKTKALQMGVNDEDDLGPVINKPQLEFLLSMISNAKEQGSKILCGGKENSSTNGYYFEPTIVEGPDSGAEISRVELFGPVAVLYKVSNLKKAILMANDSEYGLTSCIHTSDINKSLYFIQEIDAGVANVNSATYGNEPHMPFGGLKNSGNGTREPGSEAVDFYTRLKNVSFTLNEKGF